ncbi:cytochrome P450 [Dactylosporangium sp. NPDC005555]|uniref:cytochrome P450 n=1 Tax=Dactylosporangium sp. NPDC005555 TaxID=3154889 RepID=UPI0033B47524
MTSDLDSAAFADGRAFGTLRRMRADEPCVRTPFSGARPAWNLVRHADVVAALRQPNRYSSAAGGTTLQDQTPQEISYNRSMLHVDPPEHTRLREQFQAAFRPDALLALGPAIDDLAHDVLDAIWSREEVDVVQELAAPMVAYSLCRALGVPDDLRDYFMRLSALMLADTVPDPAAVDYQRLRLPPALVRSFGGSPSRAMMRLLGVRSAERNWLIPRRSGDGPPAGAIEDLLVILATAGTGMTQNCIVMGLRYLAERWDFFSANRAHLLDDMRPLVEEVIRIACPLYHVRRTVAEDHELHGRLLRQGDKVLLWLYSGNMDDAVFDDPDDFRADRRPNPHLSFGRGGPHYCLGAALARMEVAGVLRAVLERATSVRALAPPTMLRSNFVRETSLLPMRIG